MKADPTRQYETQKTGKELLRERYTDGAEHFDPRQAMYTVRAAAYGYFDGDGQERPPVPAEDVLAALTQLDEVRRNLDALELDLIHAARTRNASWQRIAGALALATRQSAESRALRLERDREEHGRSRNVPAQRVEKARQRAADAWCQQHADRVRETAQTVVDTAGVWPAVQDSPCARADAHRLAQDLASGAEASVLADRLTRLRFEVLPYGTRSLPATADPRAEEAARARDALTALFADLDAVCGAVRTARDRPKATARREAVQAEVLEALIPYVRGGQSGAVSQRLYRALYRLDVEVLRGNDPAWCWETVAELGAKRLRLPADEQGRRLRAALDRYAVLHREEDSATPDNRPAPGSTSADR